MKFVIYTSRHAIISISVLKNCGECLADKYWTQHIPTLFQSGFRRQKEVCLPVEMGWFGPGSVFVPECWAAMWRYLLVWLSFVWIFLRLFLSQRADLFFIFFPLKIWLFCFFNVSFRWKSYINGCAVIPLKGYRLLMENYINQLEIIKSESNGMIF